MNRFLKKLRKENPKYRFERDTFNSYAKDYGDTIIVFNGQFFTQEQWNKIEMFCRLVRDGEV